PAHGSDEEPAPYQHQLIVGQLLFRPRLPRPPATANLSHGVGAGSVERADVHSGAARLRKSAPISRAGPSRAAPSNSSTVTPIARSSSSLETPRTNAASARAFISFGKRSSPRP